MWSPTRQRKSEFKISNFTIILFGIIVSGFFFRVLFDNFYLAITTLTGHDAVLSKWTTGSTMITVLIAAAVMIVGAMFWAFDRNADAFQRIRVLPPAFRRKVALYCLATLCLLVASQLGIIVAAWLIESGRFADGATTALNGYPIEFLTESPIPQIFGVFMSNGGLLFGVYMLLPDPPRPPEDSA